MTIHVCSASLLLISRPLNLKMKTINMSSKKRYKRLIFFFVSIFVRIESEKKSVNSHFAENKIFTPKKVRQIEEFNAIRTWDKLPYLEDY